MTDYEALIRSRIRIRYKYDTDMCGRVRFVRFVPYESLVLQVMLSYESWTRPTQVVSVSGTCRTRTRARHVPETCRTRVVSDPTRIDPCPRSRPGVTQFGYGWTPERVGSQDRVGLKKIRFILINSHLPFDALILDLSPLSRSRSLSDSGGDNDDIVDDIDDNEESKGNMIN